MVKLIRRQVISEAKQAGTLYHVCNLNALANYIAPNDILKGSGKYKNWLLGGRTDIVSFTRDKHFIVKTQENKKSHVLFDFEVDGNKLSENHKIIPYNDLLFDTDSGDMDDSFPVDPKYLEHEEVVVGSIHPFSKYVKKVRFGVSITSFNDILLLVNSDDFQTSSSYLKDFKTEYDPKLVIEDDNKYVLNYPSYNSFTDSFNSILSLYNSNIYDMDKNEVKKAFNGFTKSQLDSLLLKTLLDISVKNKRNACCLLVYAGADYDTPPIHALLRSNIKFVKYLWPVLSEDDKLEYAQTHLEFEIIKPIIKGSDLTGGRALKIVNKKGKDLINALDYYKILFKDDLNHSLVGLFKDYLENN